MKIYDISQEVFSCAVYPGDPAPVRKEELRMSRGDSVNLSSFSMCAHNGTHIDAPFHFFEEGATVERLPLSSLAGLCCVCAFDGEMTYAQAKALAEQATAVHTEGAKRILIKGNATVTAEASRAFCEAGCVLLGIEGQSFGEEGAPKKAHELLLSHAVVLLEGIRLKAVPCGVYLLCAAPLNLRGCDGAPCRALLFADFA